LDQNSVVSNRLSTLRENTSKSQEMVRDFHQKLLEQIERKKEIEVMKKQKDASHSPKIKEDLLVCSKRIELYFNELSKYVNEYHDVYADLIKEELAVQSITDSSKVSTNYMPLIHKEDIELDIPNRIIQNCGESVLFSTRKTSNSPVLVDSSTRGTAISSSMSISQSPTNFPPRPLSPAKYVAGPPPTITKVSSLDSQRSGISYAFNPNLLMNDVPKDPKRDIFGGVSKMSMEHPTIGKSPEASSISIGGSILNSKPISKAISSSTSSSQVTRIESKPANHHSVKSVVLPEVEYDAMINNISLLSNEMLKHGVDQMYVDVAQQLAITKAENLSLKRTVQRMNSDGKSTFEDIGWRRYWITKIHSQIVMIDMGLQNVPTDDQHRAIQERFREQLYKLKRSLEQDGVPLTSLVGKTTTGSRPLTDPELRSKIVYLTQQLHSVQSENLQLKGTLDCQRISTDVEFDRLKENTVSNCEEDSFFKQEYTRISQDFEKLDSKYKTETSDLEYRVKAYQRTIAQLSKEKLDIERQLVDSNEKSAKKYNQLKAKQSETDSKLSLVTSELDLIKKEMKDFQIERDVWKEESVHTQKQSGLLAEQLSAQEEEFAIQKENLKSHIASLEKQLDLMNVAFDQSQEKLSECTRRADLKIAQLLSEQSQLKCPNETSTCTSHYVKVIDSMQQQLDQSRVELNILIDSKKTLEANNQFLQSRIKNIETGVIDSDHGHSLYLHMELKNANEIIEKQTKQLKKWSQQSQIMHQKELEADLINAKAKINALTEKLHLETSNVEILKKTLDDVANASWW
jgi:hypothetical protein